MFLPRDRRRGCCTSIVVLSSLILYTAIVCGGHMFFRSKHNSDFQIMDTSSLQCRCYKIVKFDFVERQTIENEEVVVKELIWFLSVVTWTLDT